MNSGTNPRLGIYSSIAGSIGSGLLWLISFKLVATWLGPEGVGLFSQIRQIIQASTVSATFGGSNLMVQGIAAEPQESSRRQLRVTAARLIGLTGLLCVMLIIFTAPQLAHFFFSSTVLDAEMAVYWIALAVALSIASTYALGVINGYRSYVHLALTQVAGPMVLAVVIATFWWQGLAFDATLLVQCFVVCFGITFTLGMLGMPRQAQEYRAMKRVALPRVQRLRFFRLAAANLLGALSGTLALLLIRSWIINEHGLDFAGLFDAGWTLTFNYATVFLAACNAFYLPTLSAAIKPEEQRVCVLKMAYLVLGVCTTIFYTLVLFSKPFISLLYSAQFHPAAEALRILAIAVVFRSVSWVYGSVIFATRQSLTLVSSELALNATLLATALYALDHDLATLRGISWAFVLTHFLYLVFTVEYAHAKNKSLRRIDIWPLLLAAILPFLYIAEFPSGVQKSYFSVAQWFFLFSGLATSSATWFAYRRTHL